MVFASYSSASMQRLVSKFSGFGGTEACIAYMATTPATTTRTLIQSKVNKQTTNNNGNYNI